MSEKKMPVKGRVYFRRMLMKIWPFSACWSFSLWMLVLQLVHVGPSACGCWSFSLWMLILQLVDVGPSACACWSFSLCMLVLQLVDVGPSACACWSFSLCPPCQQTNTDNLQDERSAYFRCI